MRYLYLHGLASGPLSAKAKYLRDRFDRRGIPLLLPDFNAGGFKGLTLSRQIEQVEALLRQEPPATQAEAITLIGSSLGGLTAAWLAERNPQVQRVILLAPAFEFRSLWLAHIGAAAAATAEQEGYRLIFHYAYGYPSPLGWGFVKDLEHFPDQGLGRSVPTLILHGTGDRVIPIQCARDYGRSRPWVQLLELDSDHSLGNVTSRIWAEIQAYCGL
jgi:uncharacterized protein